MTYEECVEYILSVPLFASKLGTKNLDRILNLMNHPEKTYPVIHVAGTNGKGSTCTFLASMLKQKGKKVGVFTSPHLIRINERIRIGDEIISDEDFLAVFLETMHYIELAKEQGIAHPSFFELMFLMAVVYFQKQEVEFAIVETGMGGRLDATNIVTPVLCIITSVGLDHMQYLGDTIEKIAGEKAGIIKERVPVIYFDRKDAATKVIRQYAEKMNAPVNFVEKSQYKLLKITDKVIDFSFESGYYSYVDLQIKKTALYQIENAILAIKAYELLGFGEKNSLCTDKTIPDVEVIQNGLLDMVWHCRMECIAPHIYVDGAHNEEAIEAFCETLEVLFKEERKVLCFAVSQDKDYKRMIRRLCRVDFDEIIVVRYEGDRAAQLEEVEHTFRQCSGCKVTTFEKLEDGFRYGKRIAKDKDLFCVGSLYLAGNILSLGE